MSEPCKICGVIHTGECSVHHLKKQIVRLRKKIEELKWDYVGSDIDSEYFQDLAQERSKQIDDLQNQLAKAAGHDE